MSAHTRKGRLRLHGLRRLRAFACVLASTALGLACADDDAGRFGPDGAELAESRVEPGPLQLATHEVSLSVDESLKLTAAYERADATGSSDVTAKLSWSSADPSIAWVHAGKILGVYPGKTEITARYAGTSDRVQVTVTTDGLRAIALQPDTLELARGTTATLRAIGVFSQDAKRDLTALVTWRSQDSAVAELAGNTVRGLELGEVAIEAALSGVTGKLSLRVTEARLRELSVLRERELMELGSTQQLRALGRFSDGESLDVTELATWSSDDGNLALVDSRGVVSARATGEVGIWTRYAGMAAQTSVSITPLGQAQPD